MKKTLIICGVVVGIAGLAAIVYYGFYRPEKEKNTPIPTITGIDIQHRGENMAKRQYYQTQIAIYEAIVKAAPNSQDARKKLELLKNELNKIP